MKSDIPPRLRNITEVVIQELIGSSVDVALQHHNTQLQRILEGLMAHFFSTHLPAYNVQDIQWFLEMANKNVQWNVEHMSHQLVENVIESKSSSPVDEYDSKGCISMSLFKHYLTIILDKADISNVGTTSMTTLTLYKPWVRIEHQNFLLTMFRYVKWLVKFLLKVCLMNLILHLIFQHFIKNVMV